MRRSIGLLVLAGTLVIAWVAWQRQSSLAQQQTGTPGATVDKQPAVFANRTFDPASPSAEMPPLSPGEEAECDSNFKLNASVGGQPKATDATHGIVTVSGVKVSLQLNVTIWTPVDPTLRVVEHEQGHRQISEFYYQTADKLAERIASTYVGKQVEISGGDLSAASSKALQQLAVDITNDYNNQLNAGATQALYDTLTDHGRNDVTVQDAVTAALKDATPAITERASAPGN